jgi:hypothetical protein
MRFSLFDREAKILQDCLEALAAGETLEDILRHYPGREESLRAKLSTAEWLAKQNQSLEPRPGFLLASQKRLVSDLRARTTPRQKAGRQVSVRLRRFAKALQPAVVLLFLLVLINIPFQLMQGARIALPGDELYLLKRFQEQTRLVLTPDPLGDALLQVRYTQQRTAELQELILDGRFEDLDLAVAGFQDQYQAAEYSIELVGRGDPLLAENMQRIMKESLREQEVVFSFLIAAVPRSLRIGLEQALLMAYR